MSMKKGSNGKERGERGIEGGSKKAR